MTRARRTVDAALCDAECAGARAKARRTFAAARLRLCANVFACSRIHFDPNFHVVRLANANDRFASTDRDADADPRLHAAERVVARARADAKITIH